MFTQQPQLAYITRHGYRTFTHTYTHPLTHTHTHSHTHTYCTHIHTPLHTPPLTLPLSLPLSLTHLQALAHVLLQASVSWEHCGREEVQVLSRLLQDLVVGQVTVMFPGGCTELARGLWGGHDRGSEMGIIVSE